MRIAYINTEDLSKVGGGRVHFRAVASELVNLGKSVTVTDLTQKIIAITGSSSKIEYGPVRAGDMKHSCAFVDKLFLTKFRPNSSFQEGFVKTVSWFKDKEK